MTPKEKEIRLSSAQKNVIKQMQAGVICHYLSGINARCFLSGGGNINWTTIYALEGLGLIKRHDGYVSLTEKGKSICIK